MVEGKRIISETGPGKGLQCKIDGGARLGGRGTDPVLWQNPPKYTLFYGKIPHKIPCFMTKSL